MQSDISQHEELIVDNLLSTIIKLQTLYYAFKKNRLFAYLFI